MTTALADEELRTWTLVVPAPVAWLTANNERQRYERGRLVRAWRYAVVRACELANLPKGIHGPVTIEAVIQYVGRRPVRDTSNLFPTIKACVDGLVPPRTVRRRDGGSYRTHGYGLLVDDSDKHLTAGSPKWRVEALPIGDWKLRHGRVVLRITDHGPAALF